MERTKIVVLIFLIALLSNCNEKVMESEFHSNDYNILIKYRSSASKAHRGWDKSRYSLDSLHLFFDYYPTLSNDSSISMFSDSIQVSIYRNRTLFLTKQYSKKELFNEGVDYFNCGHKSEIGSIGIRINNGNLCYAEIDSMDCILKVSFSDFDEKLLSLEFLDEMPFFR